MGSALEAFTSIITCNCVTKGRGHRQTRWPYVVSTQALPRTAGTLPPAAVVEVLDAQTSRRTFRTDRAAPAGMAGVTQTDLYFEFEFERR